MTKQKKLLAALAASFAFAGAYTEAQAGVLVGQCVEFAGCYSDQSPTAWSYDLSLGELSGLGLGSNQAFIVEQTSQYIIRLGVTTITFNTGSGTVTETLGEFNGTSGYNDPGPYETDIVGYFAIPVDALSGTISGTFGNSAVPNSAGVDLWLGQPVPEPETYAMLMAGLGVLGAVARRRTRRAA